MPTPLASLDFLCPTWKRCLTPDAVAALERGIAWERERFRGKPFVVATRQQRLNYDGIRESFALEAGFATAADAIAHAEQCQDQAFQAALAAPTYDEYRWL